MSQVASPFNGAAVSPRPKSGVAVWLAVGGAIALFLLFLGGSYNRLVTLDQAVQGQWAQVENAYQRRADLVPNLVETVKGAANFEKETYVAVAEARSKVGAAPATVPDAQGLEQFEQQQQALGGALSRLMVVVERYPELKATGNFQDLQAQLEGTENRIAVERMRFNEAAQQFNVQRNRFPSVLVAGMFGPRFATKPFFAARAGSQVPPAVKF